MIQFYGKADRNRDGVVKSEYPGWYLDHTHIDELKDSINRNQTLLDSGLCPPQRIGIIKATLDKEKNNLDSILASKPELSSAEKDKLAKVRKTLGELIKATMFSHSDMMKGIVDDHEEARRMVEFIIDVSGDVIYETVKAAEVPMFDGKVTREGATKVWKLIGKLLGEPTNAETLRKP